jgi:hypothetical protein
LTRRPALTPVFAFIGLALALGIGVLVLHRLSRLPGPPRSPVNHDSPTGTEPGTRAVRARE